MADAAAARDRQDRQSGVAPADLDDRLDAVLLGHEKIGDHQVEALALDQLESLGAVLRHADVRRSQHGRGQPCEERLIVNEQDPGHLASGASPPTGKAPAACTPTSPNFARIPIHSAKRVVK